jgi:hypothetical protein
MMVVRPQVDPLTALHPKMFLVGSDNQITSNTLEKQHQVTWLHNRSVGSHSPIFLKFFSRTYKSLVILFTPISYIFTNTLPFPAPRWGKMGAARGGSVSYVPVGSTKASSTSSSSTTPKPKPSPSPSVSSSSNTSSDTIPPAGSGCTYRGLECVISGGETGADKGGLLAARSLGVNTGGTAPKAFKTENGPDRTLAQYGLIEEPSMGFSDISMMNVEMSDGTIAFRLHEGAGTDRTITYCRTSRYEVIFVLNV